MEFLPSYLSLTPQERWRKVRQAEAVLKRCVLCPRRCAVDRTSDERGFCRTGDRPFVSSWGPHFGEERPLVGRSGSGTVFFGRCNLGCIFCQNWTISHRGDGEEVSAETLAAIMLSLQAQGCHNVNLVTPTHQVPMILHGVALAAEDGLRIPLVYNCGGYEALETLRILEGFIDIYMPDFKYWDPAMALKYSKARDYPEVAREALREMHRQVGDLVVGPGGIARRGLILRHLVLPAGIAGTAEVVRFVAGEISRETYTNIMDQYHPCFRASEEPPLDRRITRKEFKEAVTLAVEAGLKRIDGVTV